MRKLLPVLLFILLFNPAFSQDKIHKTDKNLIEAEVIEIGINEIKYRKWDNRSGPVFIIKKEEVAFIVFRNGTIEGISEEYQKETVSDSSAIDMQNSGENNYMKYNNVIGLNYFNIVFANITLYYERFLLNKYMSIRGDVSVGLGRDNYTTTFLGFSEDYFHGILGINYYPVQLKKFSYYTGVDFMIGTGSDYNYYSYDPYYSIYQYTFDQYTYYGFHFVNGVHINISKHFVMKSSLALGLVDRYQRGLFDIHAMFELSAGIRF